MMNTFPRAFVANKFRQALRGLGVLTISICTTAAYADDVATLKQQEATLNDRCRGGSGDDPATGKACKARETTLARLKALGWCWGKEGQAGYQKEWVPCGGATVATDTYQSIELLDLKTDIKSMMGKKVAVTGFVQMLGDLAVLKSEPMDTTPIWVNVEQLPREQRKQLLGGCDFLCGGRFAGTIRRGALGPEIALERAVLR